MHSDALSATFAALSDPTRRAILARLCAGDASVGELAEPFDITLPSISRHLKVLEESNLIVREKQAQRRICRLRVDRLREASAWIAQYRAFWEAQLDSLSSYADQVNNGSED
jgi:DNA-binding transcriptional ArsR family regulator